MGMIDKVARVIHREFGWYVSDSFTDAPTGAWGTKDGDLFERLGDLVAVEKGVPQPVTHAVKRTPRWFASSGVTIGKWTAKGDAGAGLVKLEVDVEFSSKYSVACFLSDYTETQLDNLDEIGDRLAALTDESRKNWKPSRKWVYTSLKVSSGFIVLNTQNNVKVTLGGSGVLSASGVPVKVDVGGFVESVSTAVEAVGLEDISPFVKLCEVYDPLWDVTRAVWRQIG